MAMNEDEICTKVLTKHDLELWDSEVLDIRCEEEMELFGRIPGSVHCPFYIFCNDELVENRNFDRFILELINSRKNIKKLYFICESGRRSEIAAQIIKQKFPQIEIINCQGGIRRWIEDGNELIKL